MNRNEEYLELMKQLEENTPATWQDIKNVLPAVDFKTKAEIG